MAGELGGGGFLGAAGGIVAGIASFLKGFFSITARELLRLITHLKNGIIQLSEALFDGVWSLARDLARALRTFGRLIYGAVKPLALWASRKLAALEDFLKRRFKPILDFIRNIKDRIDIFYKRFIRPFLDVIDFIRQLNRVLNVFHIGFLRKLDSVLARIEDRVEAPFDWVRQHITEVENWINRIVTADGLFRRVTLLKSTWAFNTELIRQGFNGMVKPLPEVRKARMDEPVAELTAKDFGDTVRAAALEGEGEFGAAAREFADQLRIYAHQA